MQAVWKASAWHHGEMIKKKRFVTHPKLEKMVVVTQTWLEGSTDGVCQELSPKWI